MHMNVSHAGVQVSENVELAVHSHPSLQPLRHTMSDFLNEDVLCAIFEQFDLHGGSGIYTTPDVATQATLAHSARVCKAFYEPAIRVLWRRLEDCYPLFALLPQLMKVDEGNLRYGDTYVST